MKRMLKNFRRLIISALIPVIWGNPLFSKREANATLEERVEKETYPFSTVKDNIVYEVDEDGLVYLLGQLSEDGLTVYDGKDRIIVTNEKVLSEILTRYDRFKNIKSFTERKSPLGLDLFDFSLAKTELQNFTMKHSEAIEQTLEKLPSYLMGLTDKAEFVDPKNFASEVKEISDDPYMWVRNQFSVYHSAAQEKRRNVTRLIRKIENGDVLGDKEWLDLENDIKFVITYQKSAEEAYEKLMQTKPLEERWLRDLNSRLAQSVPGGEKALEKLEEYAAELKKGLRSEIDIYNEFLNQIEENKAKYKEFEEKRRSRVEKEVNGLLPKASSKLLEPGYIELGHVEAPKKTSLRDKILEERLKESNEVEYEPIDWENFGPRIKESEHVQTTDQHPLMPMITRKDGKPAIKVGDRIIVTNSPEEFNQKMVDVFAAQKCDSEAVKLCNQGKYDEAIGVFKKALTYDSGDEIAKYSIGIAKEAIAQDYNNKAADLCKQGRYDEAIDYLNKALSYDPGYELARKNLNAIYEGLRRKSQAQIQAQSDILLDFLLDCICIGAAVKLIEQDREKDAQTFKGLSIGGKDGWKVHGYKDSEWKYHATIDGKDYYLPKNVGPGTPIDPKSKVILKDGKFYVVPP